jgi:DNA-binding phage protein
MRRTPFERWYFSVCDDIFLAAFDPDICNYQSINELAGTAGLAWATVYRAHNHQTKHPRLETLWRLARAVGMDISLIKEGMAKVAA